MNNNKTTFCFTIPPQLKNNRYYIFIYISAKCPLRLLRIISKEEKTKKEFSLPSISLCNLENIFTLIPVNFLV